MSEPLYTTSTDGLNVPQIAAVLHRALGTLGDVALHPRGCSACAKAVRLADILGIEIPPLYKDEVTE